MMRYLMLAGILAYIAFWWAVQPTCRDDEVRVRAVWGTNCIVARPR